MAATEKLRAAARAAMTFQRPVRTAVGHWLADRASQYPATRIGSILLGCMMLASCHEGVLGSLPENEKALRMEGLFSKLNRATSYSPTHLRVQYHRG